VNRPAQFGGMTFDLPIRFAHPIPFSFGEKRTGKVDFHYRLSDRQRYRPVVIWLALYPISFPL
jgi:hypothetical protein